MTTEIAERLGGDVIGHERSLGYRVAQSLFGEYETKRCRWAGTHPYGIVMKVKPMINKDNNRVNPFGDGKIGCRIVERLRWKIG